MSAFNSAIATPYRVTASGVYCVTSANAYIVGIMFMGTATNVARIWQGVTATGTGTYAHLGRIVANATTGAATVNPATWYSFPAYCSGGICISNAGAVDGSLDPNITLFWNPLSGA